MEQLKRSIYEDIDCQLATALIRTKQLNLPENFNPTFGMTLRIELIDPKMKYTLISSKKVGDKVNYEFSTEPWDKEELFKHIDLKIKNLSSVSEDSLYVPHTIMYEELNKNTAIIGILLRDTYYRYKINNVENFLKDFDDMEKTDYSIYIKKLNNKIIKNKWIKEYLNHINYDFSKDY
jgi:hypothetical protein